MRLLFQLSKECSPFLNLLKAVFNNTGAEVSLSDSTPTTVTEVIMRMREKKCTAVLVTEPKLLQLLLGHASGRLPTIDDYAGSIIESRGVEFLILNPIKQLVTVPYMKFLYSRYLSKLLKPASWLQIPEFTWEIFKPENTDRIFENFSQADFIACDIETGHEDERVITCVGFTAIFLSPGEVPVATTIVIPFTDMYNVQVIREILSLPQMKVFQNGKYDNSYLLRFGICTVNWSGDTLNLFHSWLSELPKDLAFISAFTLRRWQFWKDEANTGDINEYYRYNAKDCFATGMSWLSLMRDAPPYALENYSKEFPLVFPCLLTGMIGLRRDAAAFSAEEERLSISLEQQLISLRKMVSNPFFNPNSPVQCAALFDVLGSGDIKGTGKIPSDKVMDRHPLNRRIVKAVLKYREDRKLVGTYLRENDPKGRSKIWHGRIFYTLNEAATDTGRMASKESVFWCGMNIQNWPRDRPDIEVKNGIIADDGFLFGEVDYAQNEARGTAYLSGDTALITAVDDKSKDFHGTNASSFFGRPYSSIVDSKYDPEISEWIHKVIDKPLRNDVAKRVNHGANYNMQEQVLLDTMGIAAVRRAKQLLSLPDNWSLIRVCSHLLGCFDTTYPVIRGPWYAKCVNDVVSSGLLVGPTGWTRRCFGNPKAAKHWLNAYVAHPPQSLAAIQLNIAYLSVFQIAISEPVDFKLGPQIHDSILFQYRKGRLDLVWKIADAMRVPIEVTDTFGKKRTLIVPVDVKGEADRWSKVSPMRRK